MSREHEDDWERTVVRLPRLCDCESQDCFPCAVDLAVRELTSYGSAHLVATSDPFIAAYQAALEVRIGPAVRWENGVYVLGARQYEELPALLRAARTDRAAFDIAMALAADLVAEGRPLPLVMRNWAANAMVGAIERPAQSGRPASAIGRDQVILYAVRHLVHRTNLTATRNDGSPPESACDAVAKALSLLGRKPASYKSVLRIWRARVAR